MKKALNDELIIEDKKIGQGHPCLVVPEVGVNHNGSTKIALEMIDVIADAGAECVKFQTFNPREFINNSDEYYEYISQGKVVRESQMEMFKRLEISYSDFSKLFERARKKGLIPLSTPTDAIAADLLESIGAGGFKIGSDDLVYTPFIEYVASKGKPMILSTGMADLVDIERAVESIRGSNNYQVCLLHCVSTYPTDPGDVNLNKINELRDIFFCPVGFSDHSDGILAALGSIALGAVIVEKHFTLDKQMAGPDHRFSMDPDELSSLIEGVQKLELMLGEREIGPVKGELEMREIARRSIVAAKPLYKGHVIKREDLAYQRPGSGLMPYVSMELVGKVVEIDIEEGEQLGFSKLSK